MVASTLPYLTSFGSEIDEATGKRRLSLIVKNGGVGPALIGWFVLRYKGVAYGKPEALLHACCGVAASSDQQTGLIYSNLTNTILAARDSTDFLTLSPAADPMLVAALGAARHDLRSQACYCSVLNDCWVTDFGPERPRPVAACQVPAGVVTW